MTDHDGRWCKPLLLWQAKKYLGWWSKQAGFWKHRAVYGMWAQITDSIWSGVQVGFWASSTLSHIFMNMTCLWMEQYSGWIVVAQCLQWTRKQWQTAKSNVSHPRKCSKAKWATETRLNPFEVLPEESLTSERHVLQILSSPYTSISPGFEEDQGYCITLW